MTGVPGCSSPRTTSPAPPSKRGWRPARSAQSLRRILDEILGTLKLESGRMSSGTRSPPDQRALVAELAKSLFAPQLEGKGLTMPVTVDPAVPA
ncbi:MAG: hypothetical protein H6730_35155 [Deltaproteobacteria bacterium]|nr:hypothetical protein [Deltaproteobacteria bacterium]